MGVISEKHQLVSSVGNKKGLSWCNIFKVKQKQNKTKTTPKKNGIIYSGKQIIEIRSGKPKFVTF